MPPAARAVARHLPALIAIVGVAVLAALLEPHAYPSYDYAFTIASAQDVLAGRGTGYLVPVYSPVSHPFTLGEALAFTAAGLSPFPFFVAVTLLAFGLLCYSIFRIATTIASWPVGLLAAALVFTTPAIFELATRTYGDVVAAALVAAAVALEVTRPRRGWPVLAVLVLAGLLRPEAWLLSGAYWLYLSWRAPWRRRLGLGALAAVAPAVWLAHDALLTGDPLHSFEVTRVYTRKAQATVSLDSIRVALHAVAGWPVLAGAAIGAVIGWRRFGPAVLVPLVAGAALLLTTVAPAVLGESPVLRRYLVLPGAMLSLLFAIACVGWTASRTPSPRWRIGGIALLALAIGVLAPERVDRWEQHRRAQAGREELLEHLREWVATPAARAYLAAPECTPILVPGYGYRPYLRYWLDVPPRKVAFRFPSGDPSDGIVLLPTRIDSYQRVMLADVGEQTSRNLLASREFTTRFRRVAGTPRWDLYAGPACRRDVASTTRSSPSDRDTSRRPTFARLSRSSGAASGPARSASP